MFDSDHQDKAPLAAILGRCNVHNVSRYEVSQGGIQPSTAQRLASACQGRWLLVGILTCGEHPEWLLTDLGVCVSHRRFLAAVARTARRERLFLPLHIQGVPVAFFIIAAGSHHRTIFFADQSCFQALFVCAWLLITGLPAVRLPTLLPAAPHQAV